MKRRAPGELGALLLGQPELSEQVMRALDLKGDLPQLLEAGYQSVILTEDLTSPEFNWLRRKVRLSQGTTVAAVGGQFSQAAFAPTAGAARTLAVVEKLIITNTQAAAVQNYLIDSQPNINIGAAPNVPKSALDDRAIPFNQLQPTPSFGLVSATAAAAITGTGAMFLSIPASTTLVLPLDWVFTARTVLSTPAPSLLLVQAQAVNTALTFAVVWRERPMTSSETL
jgi:hypothetical protein